ncbi:hypothetical protein SBOR_7063 [Sclerotinia borealis F-4128]|uniref:Uncharacterized protein n=1 Tax=Sclerotinia borealis (strain F-4128) TaxID=1432307 RepID=W9C6Z5_SCLBF|nr:hypothetical protein SBOR_7063 [Sclerotinia borealis F-4128]
MYKALNKSRAFVPRTPSTSQITNTIHGHRLSTYEPRRSEPKWNLARGKPAKSDLKEPQNPSIGLNFKELGATRTVRWVVIVVISIASMMETMFWTKVLMRKLGWGKGNQREEMVGEEGEEEEKKGEE